METMKCEHDWVDGACGATAPLGTPGWERRTGRNGDRFWLCPDDAAVAAMTPRQQNRSE